MKYYFKQAIFLVLYNVFMAIIAFAILLIPENLLWLQLVAHAANIGLYLFIACAMLYKEGQTAVKILHANDLEREQIIKTGNALPLKVHEEYKPWKGYFIGFLIGAPIILGLIVHSILIAVNVAYVGGGAVTAAIYMAFFGPISTFFGDKGFFPSTVPIYAQYYLLVYAIAVLSVACGIAYNFGARKIQRNYDKIREKQRQIYGE